MIRKLVLATHNAGKRVEIADLLAPLHIKVISAAELKLPEPDETGTTFRANALLKAEAACTASGLPALADDSGLCIPALFGAPGVYSADWCGPQRNYQTAFERIQRELAGADPAAYFMCTLCLKLPDAAPHFFEGRVDGRLTFPPRGRDGFGYDPIFIPEGFDITFGEMPRSEKQALSHRARAMAALVDFLQQKG